ncbi:hypothetical protein LWI29_006460 [Acer saccharum]|uniref:F-box domain-containing protein n=1 Tax=Acer saccharum TaxID=4024 RepID=A0AA39VN90_ACESA|nr:hypothetical protein LWI29_006460 [Acer saccharum]
MTSPSESQSPICVGLGNLPDKLLVKIFDHLPSQSDVVVCTAVCKHWFSLISTFFLDHTIHRHKVENVNTSFTFLIKSSGPGYVEGTSSNPLLKRTGRSQLLKFLSCYMPDEPFAIHPVASFKDLLLCHQRPLCESVYYLCNILTKQWFKLPRVLEDQEVELETMHGLICYPSFPCHHQNCTNLYSQYSYRVVRILLPRQNKSHQQFTVEIFCSVTGTWSKSVVSSPRPFTIIIKTWSL